MKAQGKRFLTKRGDEGGSVRWSINTDEYSNKSIESYLTLTDCGGTITLEFSYHTSKGYDKRVAKLDAVIEELQSMRTALVGSKPKPPKYYY